MVSNRITDECDAIGCIVKARMHADFINAMHGIPIIPDELEENQEQEQEETRETRETRETQEQEETRETRETREQEQTGNVEVITSEVINTIVCQDIEIQQISIHDRLQNSEMLCGNN